MSENGFHRLFRERLEARYQLEQSEKARAEMAANPDRIFQSVVAKYDDKINSIHNECENLMMNGL